MRSKITGMIKLPHIARCALHACAVLVSGVVIVLAVGFGFVAFVAAALMIGLAGVVVSQLKPQYREAPLLLKARRSGRGWIVDPSGGS
jgi:hypothetical protein